LTSLTSRGFPISCSPGITDRPRPFWGEGWGEGAKPRPNAVSLRQTMAVISEKSQIFGKPVNRLDACLNLCAFDQ